MNDKPVKLFEPTGTGWLLPIIRGYWLSVIPVVINMFRLPDFLTGNNIRNDILTKRDRGEASKNTKWKT
jgi:hypothetical protein